MIRIFISLVFAVMSGAAAAQTCGGPGAPCALPSGGEYHVRDLL